MQGIKDHRLIAALPHGMSGQQQEGGSQLSASIMDNCMSDEIPAIWVKIITRGRKPLIIGGLYREHHLLLQPSPNNTDSRQLQKQRWMKSLRGWLKASRQSKCILVGDTNLDQLKWTNPEYRVSRMVQDTKDLIETQGFGQLVRGPTRAWPGQVSSLVDQLWTNSPGNVISVRNIVRSASDHNLISAVIRTKDREEQAHEISRRDRKNMDLQRYRMKIKHIDWSEFYDSQDINILNDIFVKKIGDILDEEAPLKNHQVRRHLRNWLTDDIKAEMKDRDTSREVARRSGDPVHWRNYR